VRTGASPLKEVRFAGTFNMQFRATLNPRSPAAYISTVHWWSSELSSETLVLSAGSLITADILLGVPCVICSSCKPFKLIVHKATSSVKELQISSVISFFLTWLWHLESF
jgi:hypothetical protein